MAQNPEVVHGGGPTHHHNLVGQSAMAAHSGDAVMAGEGHTIAGCGVVALCQGVPFKSKILESGLDVLTAAQQSRVCTQCTQAVTQGQA